MRSRLTISLAQLTAGNNSEKLENEMRQLLYFNIWSMLFKNGNNIYEHFKQQDK